MNFCTHLATLRRTPNVIAASIADLSSEQLLFVPPSGNWSIGAVLCHLADEEKEDFRTRVRMTLEKPKEPWPAIDPQAWALTRNYQGQNPQDALARFANERRISLDWLQSLENPNWKQAYQHPKFGAIYAGELMASWAAHDVLHVRQITKRIYELTSVAAGDFSTRYAGAWTA